MIGSLIKEKLIDASSYIKRTRLSDEQSRKRQTLNLKVNIRLKDERKEMKDYLRK